MQKKNQRHYLFLLWVIGLFLFLNACNSPVLPACLESLRARPAELQQVQQVGAKAIQELLDRQIPLPVGYRSAFSQVQRALYAGKFQMYFPEKITGVSANGEIELGGTYIFEANTFMLVKEALLPGAEDRLTAYMLHELVHAAQDNLYQGKPVSVAQTETEAYLVEHLYLRQVLGKEYIEPSVFRKQAEQLASTWMDWQQGQQPLQQQTYLTFQSTFVELLKQEGYAISEIHVRDGIPL